MDIDTQPPIIDEFEENSINAVIGQVRAASDAFYKSKLSPWTGMIAVIK